MTELLSEREFCSTIHAAVVAFQGNTETVDTQRVAFTISILTSMLAINLAALPVELRPRWTGCVVEKLPDSVAHALVEIERLNRAAGHA